MIEFRQIRTVLQKERKKKSDIRTKYGYNLSHENFQNSALIYTYVFINVLFHFYTIQQKKKATKKCIHRLGFIKSDNRVINTVVSLLSATNLNICTYGMCTSFIMGRLM